MKPSEACDLSFSHPTPVTEDTWGPACPRRELKPIASTGIYYSISALRWARSSLSLLSFLDETSGLAVWVNGYTASDWSRLGQKVSGRAPAEVTTVLVTNLNHLGGTPRPLNTWFSRVQNGKSSVIDFGTWVRGQ